MVCPKCGRQMDWYIDGLVRPGFNSRYCMGCKSRLELVNPSTPYMATGLIFVLILFGLVMGQAPHLWLWLILLGLVFWLVNPVFIRLLGRWAVYDYTQAEISKANLINAVNTISTLITAVWVGYLIMILILPYWKIVGLLAQMDDRAFEAAQEYAQILKPARFFAIAAGVISIGLSGSTSFMRYSLRKESFNRKLKQQGEVESKGI
jgi:phosphoglycerol transferase MdoB-like AlkP superfamily enzyme